MCCRGEYGALHCCHTGLHCSRYSKGIYMLSVVHLQVHVHCTKCMYNVYIHVHVYTVHLHVYT